MSIALVQEEDGREDFQVEQQQEEVKEEEIRKGLCCLTKLLEFKASFLW